jgi:serine/threonine-protein kinase
MLSAIPLQRIEGKYEILEKLGEGGMGAVYKVRHRLLDEVRVIKVMRPQLSPAEDLVARFSREARAATQLRHPNIAQLYDFSIDDDGFAFIVMEYIAGLTLQVILRQQGTLPFGLSLEVAQQALRALAFLHGKSYVHRDISPDNLMLTEGEEGGPQVKLIDLGIAKALEAGAGGGGLTQAGMFLGKVRYAPPEQFRADGAAAVDARGDLYAFMVVLYEMLTGRYPISGRDATSIIAGHLFFPPLDFAESDPNGRVPEEMRALLLKGLAKDPADRFATAQEISQALAAFRRPEDIGENDLDMTLRPVPAPTGARLPSGGSTQMRLDKQFELRTTPTPHRLAESAELEKAQALAAVVAEVEEKLARGNYRAAEMQLYDAEIDFGQQKIFLTLHGKLADLRRRQLEEKAEARRRAEEIAAAAAEVEGRIARGDLDRAGRALAEAVERYGEAAPFLQLRQRLQDLRQG